MPYLTTSNATLTCLPSLQGDFLKEMEENEDVRFHVHRIETECELNQVACKEYRQPFLKHRWMWKNDIQGSLQHFLDEEGGMDPPVIAEGAEGAEGDKGFPSLLNFQKRINELKDEEGEIKAIDGTVTEGWLKIDAKPVKTTLGKTAAQWSDAHTTYLKDYIDTELINLQEFITKVSTGLGTEVEENDQEKLIEAMTYVRDVRLSSDRIDSLFAPLKETIGLLKKFAIAMPEETLETLEMIPFKWEDTKKTTINARELLGPLQSLQQEKVREYTDEFRSRVQVRTMFARDFLRASMSMHPGCACRNSRSASTRRPHLNTRLELSRHTSCLYSSIRIFSTSRKRASTSTSSRSSLR